MTSSPLSPSIAASLFPFRFLCFPVGLVVTHTPYIMSLPSECSHFEPYFVLPDEKLHALVKQFRKEMEGGLNEYGKAVAMVPSFVTGVPDGTEQGYVSTRGRSADKAALSSPSTSAVPTCECSPGPVDPRPDPPDAFAKCNCLGSTDSRSSSRSTRSRTNSRRGKLSSYSVGLQ